MFHRIGIKTAAIASTIVLAMGSPLAFGASPAFASGYTAQICANNGTTTACLNAWYGGPAVDVYTAMGAEPNDEFFVGTLSNGDSYLEFTGGGPYSGQCVGDFNNNSGYADAGLDPCPTTSNGGGWGTNFQIQACKSGEGTAFYNNRWGGYLAPGGFSKSDAFYLNHSGQYCFGVTPPSEK
jgi:hypothetical protein